MTRMYTRARAYDAHGSSALGETAAMVLGRRHGIRRRATPLITATRSNVEQSSRRWYALTARQKHVSIRRSVRRDFVAVFLSCRCPATKRNAPERAGETARIRTAGRKSEIAPSHRFREVLSSFPFFLRPIGEFPADTRFPAGSGNDHCIPAWRLLPEMCP